MLDKNKEYIATDDRFKVVFNNKDKQKIYNKGIKIITNDVKYDFNGLLINKTNDSYAVEVSWDLSGNVMIASIPGYFIHKILNGITDTNVLVSKLEKMFRLKIKN